MQGCVELLRDYLQKVGEVGRVFPPELTSAVLQGTGRGVSSSIQAGSTPLSSSATSSSDFVPSPSPPRRSRRRARNGGAL